MAQQLHQTLNNHPLFYFEPTKTITKEVGIRTANSQKIYNYKSKSLRINAMFGYHAEREKARHQGKINPILHKDVMHHSTDFLLPDSLSDSELNYALVILNQPLPRFTPLLWDHAKFRVCADGGANRLYDQTPHFFPQQDPLYVRPRFIPDVIKGDLDSIRADVLDFYAKLGCNAINDSHDQDTTDLHKCISHLSNLTPESEKSKLCILVVGALGGRFDHEAANINILHHFSSSRIILLSDDCLIQLLPNTHHHEIHIESSVVGPHCGLFPMGQPSWHTTTSGLQWDLAHTALMFGEMISTSNLVSRETVSVSSDADLVWTISIKSTQK